MKNFLNNKNINLLNKTLSNIFCFLFPISCSICSKILPSDDYNRLCNECEKNIKFNSSFFCVICAIPLEHGGMHCPTCIKNLKTSYKFIRSVGIYEGILKDLIVGLKYQNKHYCNRILAKLLAQTYNIYFKEINIDILIPIPMHPIKKLFHNYNHCELLSNELSKLLSISTNNKTLLKTKLTRSQAKLNRAQRLNNLTNAFKISDNKIIEGKNILLIDDVCTTTTTIQECATTLKNAGAKNVYALCLARDILHK